MTYQINRKQTKMREPQAVRADFKEAYYGIGDKIVGLENLKKDMEHPRGRIELANLVSQFNDLHEALRKFGDQNLKNWD